MKFKNYYALLILLTVFLSFSCTKEKKEANSNITTQINKIETSLKEGETKIEGYNQTYSKIEMRAPESYIKIVRDALENSYSKKSAALSMSSSYLVGVLSSGSCGSFRKLRIYMDCEDDAPDSRSTGWTGDSSVNGGNVNLYFCIVDGSNFLRSNTQAYATLRLDASLPQGVSTFRRYFDNEDVKNGNNTLIDDVVQPKVNTMGACSFSDNDLLAFNYYTLSSTTTSFPYLGISYGVIGSFGYTQGNIHSDDEDYYNSDWTDLTLFDDASQTYMNNVIVPSGSVGDLISGEGQNKNTTLYFSKVY